MTDLRGRTFSDLVAGLNAGQHLAVDAVVAFVDGELDDVARERAAAHLMTCQACAAEVAGQRQARTMIRSARCPQPPANLLAALHDIPERAGLTGTPDGLAVAEDGTVVAFADPRRAPLGGGPRWGTGPSTLGRRIGRMGAGAVVSSLVLGALIIIVSDNQVADSTVPQPDEAPAQAPASPALPVIPAVARPNAQPDAAASDEAILQRMTTLPGWHSLRLPR